MSQTPFSQLADYLEPADGLTQEQIEQILATPFQNMVVEYVIENALSLANALAAAGFMPDKTQARQRLAVARAIIGQCTANGIMYSPPSTSTPAPASETSGSVVRFMADLPENLDIYELVTRIDNSLANGEQPDPRYVQAATKIVGNKTYFLRGAQPGRFDLQGSIAILRSVGVQGNPPNNWEFKTTYSLSEVLRRQLYANPFTRVALYSENEPWLSVSEELRQVVIYFLRFKRLQLDEATTFEQVSHGEEGLSPIWSGRLNEWRDLMRNTDARSIDIVSRVIADLYFQEGGQSGSGNSPFSVVAVGAEAQIVAGKLNIGVLLHENQAAHFDSLESHLMGSMLGDYIHVVRISNTTLSAFLLDDVSQMRVVIELRSAPAIAWLKGKGGGLVKKIVECRTSGLMLVPVRAVACDDSSSPFGALLSLPRSSGTVSPTDEKTWQQVTEEFRRICDPMVSDMVLRQMSLEQLKKVATLMRVFVPQAESAMQGTIDTLLMRCRQENWEYNYQKLLEAINKVMAQSFD